MRRRPLQSRHPNTPNRLPRNFSGHSAEQTDLGEIWNHVVRGWLVINTTTTQPPKPTPSPQPVTDVPKPHKVAATKKTVKPEPKSTAATKTAAGKSKKKAAASDKTATAKHTTPNLVVHSQKPTSPIENSYLERLPVQACVELTRRLLTSISSLRRGVARPRAVLKTVILFVAEYGSTP